MSVVGPHCQHDRGCITCGDEGLAMEVLKLDAARGLALCADAAGRHETVEVGLVDRVARGDRLLVHAGTALLRLGDDAAPRLAADGSRAVMTAGTGERR